MNPWFFLGWLALAVVLSLIMLLLYLLGFLRGWSFYIAPVATVVLILLPLCIVGVRLLLRRKEKNDQQIDENTGNEKQAASFSSTDMGESLRRQWVGILAESKAVPLFLVLGSSQSDMQTLLSEALPLSRNVPTAGRDTADLNLYLMDTAAWLVVSPRVLGIDPSPSALGVPLPGAVPRNAFSKDGAAWDILLELLPSFPGPVVGSVLTLLPKDLTGEGNMRSELLGRRLAALRGRLKRHVPLWLILDRMDQTPGGKGFCRALQAEGAACVYSAENKGASVSLRCAEELQVGALPTKSRVPAIDVQKPFGVVLESVRSQFQPSSDGAEKPEATSGAYVRSIGDDYDRLVDSLRNLSAQYDSALLQTSPFAGDVLLLRHSLRSYKTAFCSYGDALIRHNGVELRALFLSGGTASDGSGRVFAHELFTSFIPDCAEKILRNIPYKKNAKVVAFVANAISLICVGVGMTLAVGAWQGHAILAALESGVKLLQSEGYAAQQGHDLLLPLERLYTVTALLAEQEKKCTGPSRLFKAPEKTLRDVQEQLSTRFVAPLLPTEQNKKERLALWTESLFDWSRTGIPVLEIQTPRGELLTRVDGGATAKGRQKVAELLTQWKGLVPEPQRTAIAWVQDAYDARVFALWQTAAQEVLTAVEYADGGVASDQPAMGKVPVLPPVVQMRDLLGPESLPFHVMSIVSKELSFSRERPGTPDWLVAMHAVSDVRILSRLGGTESSGNWGNTSGERWRDIVALLPNASELLAPQRFELAFQASAAWGSYESGLRALMPQAASQQGLMELISAWYSGVTASPLVEANEAYTRLHKNLTVFAPLFISERALLTRKLVESPLKVVQTQGSNSVAQMLQGKWVVDVIEPLRTVTANDMGEVLFGETGSVQRFVTTFAKPYLQATSKGYVPASVSGAVFPFTSEFISFINGNGFEPVAHPKRFPLELHILPATANSEAKQFPRGVTVRLQCGDKKIVSGAFNTKRSLAFVWAPDSCEALSLQVHFDSFSVVKEYPGHNGIVEFIYEAVSGGMTFTPDDFPDSKERLKAIGVTRIQPRFELNGGNAVIAMLEDPGIPVPKKIIRESR